MLVVLDPNSIDHDNVMFQSVPLSLFKIWAFASCGTDDRFEECPTSLDGRKVLRKILNNGNIPVIIHMVLLGHDTFLIQAVPMISLSPAISPQIWYVALGRCGAAGADIIQSTGIRVELTATRRTALHRFVHIL